MLGRRGQRLGRFDDARRAVAGAAGDAQRLADGGVDLEIERHAAQRLSRR